MAAPEVKFDFDVFISYSSKDMAWVRGELLTRIERAGVKAFIDFRDFTRGAPSIIECERGAEQCPKMLVVLTPEYIESGWAEFENILVQTLDPANRELRLIPLLKKECKKPLRIGTLTHIDFTDGADMVLAWRQLLTALGKPPEPEPPKEPPREEWFLAHPYPMPPNFTGRADERAMLTRWLNQDAEHPLLSVRALGGFGKSALTWQWLTHDVGATTWAYVVWWSFYERDAGFDNFLASTLDYLTGGKIDPGKLSGKDAVSTLLQMLRHSGTLLILDGFERELRAFGGLNAAYQGDDGNRSEANGRDCISPLADWFLYNMALQPHLRSKVLLTTRLCPRVLEVRGRELLHGCREEELLQMQPADAVAFFRAQGIRGTRAEIEGTCDPYGYHPLSLRLLAGLVVGDFQQPGDIAAARRLDVSGDLVQRQNHVLKVAFDSLTPTRQALLGRIACFRSPMSYEALKGVAEAAEQLAEALEADLHDLVARGLLHHDTQDKRFDLHPIVRHYAYERLATADRSATHTRLRDYFDAIPAPEKVTRLENLMQVIELYHHTVRAGQFDEARELYRDHLSQPLFYQFGAYTLIIDLLRGLFADGEEPPPRLKQERDQSWTLNMMAVAYSCSGQPSRAVALFEQANVLDEKHNDKSCLAVSLGNMALAQMKIGALRAAEASLYRSIALSQLLDIKKEFHFTSLSRELGRLLSYRGMYPESAMELANALKMFEKQENVQLQGVSWAYRAQLELLPLRSKTPSENHNPQEAVESARRALELADEVARTRYPFERDYVRAHWILGATQRADDEHADAERHLHEALERCRRINLVDIEADILIDLARLRAATPSTSSGHAGALDEAQRLAEEALMITERCGYVLQGADARLELAKLAIGRGEKGVALEHAREARRLATCDGPPDYTYKVAYDEAGVLLEWLGET